MIPHAKKINIKSPNLTPGDQKLIEAVYANLEKRMADDKAALAKLPTKK